MAPHDNLPSAFGEAGGERKARPFQVHGGAFLARKPGSGAGSRSVRSEPRFIAPRVR